MRAYDANEDSHVSIRRTNFWRIEIDSLSFILHTGISVMIESKSFVKCLHNSLSNFLEAKQTFQMGYIFCFEKSFSSCTDDKPTWRSFLSAFWIGKQKKKNGHCKNKDKNLGKIRLKGQKNEKRVFKVMENQMNIKKVNQQIIRNGQSCFVLIIVTHRCLKITGIIIYFVSKKVSFLPI